MKHLGMVTCSTLCFLLGTLVPITRSHAQAPPAETTYYNLSFFKSKPGQNPLAMERELWKPIHEDLRKSGTIQSWTVLAPLYMGPHEYDYLTLITFHKLDAYHAIPYESLFQKHWGKENMGAGLKRTEAARDMIGSELWYSEESLGGQ